MRAVRNRFKVARTLKSSDPQDIALARDVKCIRRLSIQTIVLSTNLKQCGCMKQGAGGQGESRQFHEFGVVQCSERTMSTPLEHPNPAPYRRVHLDFPPDSLQTLPEVSWNAELFPWVLLKGSSSGEHRLLFDRDGCIPNGKGCGE